MRFTPARLLGAALMVSPAIASAQSFTLAGDQTLTVTAQSLVSAAGNIVSDPRYLTPISPAYNGVGSIHITSNLGSFICTGSLMEDGKTVLTAAHCLTGGIGTVTAISVDFYPTNSTAVNLVGSSWNAHPLYSTRVMDENDVGVIHLAAEAPANISRYKMFTGSAVDRAFEFVGFGQKGSNGAGIQFGAGFSLGNRRQGENLFDIYAGDSRFNCTGASNCAPGQNFWNALFGTSAGNVGHVLMTDFDSGRFGNNSMCILGLFTQYTTLGTSECQDGYGLNEAISGGGDSGGPGFIDGYVASVTSFGATFGTQIGDSDNNLNSSFGEFAGFTDVAYNAPWLESQMDLTSLDPTVAGPLVTTPEPSTVVLMASGLFGVAGFARRRRKA